MATVVRVPPKRNIGGGIGDLLGVIISSVLKKREEDKKKKEQEEALSDLRNIQQAAKNPNPIVQRALRSGDVFRTSQRAGLKGGTGFRLEEQFGKTRAGVREQRAGEQLAGSLDPDEPIQAFTADILKSRDLGATGRTLLSQVGSLFPKKAAPKGGREITLFNKEGDERTVFVPAGEADPEKFVRRTKPDLFREGFSFRKPKVTKADKPSNPIKVTLFKDDEQLTTFVPAGTTDPEAFLRKKKPELFKQGFSFTKPGDVGKDTEAQRNISAVARSMGLDPDKQKDRDIAFSIIKNEEDVIQQLEKDLKRKSEEGIRLFRDVKDEIIFGFARESIREVFKAGVSGIGAVTSEAKRRGKKRFESLEFVPERAQGTAEDLARFLVDEVGLEFAEAKRLMNKNFPGAYSEEDFQSIADAIGVTASKAAATKAREKARKRLRR